MWVGLLANIGFMLSLVMLLNSLLTAVAPPLLQCGGTSQGAACPVRCLIGTARMCCPWLATHDLRAACAGLYSGPLHGHHARHPSRHRSRRTSQARFALQLYRKMVALGPSYKTRIKTSDVVQSAGEGVEQIQSFFELFLPQLFYAILAPITLFVAIAPITCPPLPSCWSARRSSSS